MNVSSAGAAQIAQTQATTASREAAETPGVPDHDGDADDGGQVAATKAALPPGVGQAVDKTA